MKDLTIQLESYDGTCMGLPLETTTKSYCLGSGGELSKVQVRLSKKELETLHRAIGLLLGVRP